MSLNFWPDHLHHMVLSGHHNRLYLVLSNLPLLVLPHSSCHSTSNPPHLVTNLFEEGCVSCDDVILPFCGYSVTNHLDDLMWHTTIGCVFLAAFLLSKHYPITNFKWMLTDIRFGVSMCFHNSFSCLLCAIDLLMILGSLLWRNHRETGSVCSTIEKNLGRRVGLSWYVALLDRHTGTAEVPGASWVFLELRFEVLCPSCAWSSPPFHWSKGPKGSLGHV